MLGNVYARGDASPEICIMKCGEGISGIARSEDDQRVPVFHCPVGVKRENELSTIAVAPALQRGR